MQEKEFHHKLSTPIGELGLKIDVEANSISQLIFWSHNFRILPVRHELIAETEKQLSQYFQHQRKHFDLPLAPHGTEFEKRVWNLVQQIPFGEVESYKSIAEKLGNSNAVRAVGRANGRNPIPILIPCHRVIGADGSLTGYAGGLDKKRALLLHEGYLTQGSLF